MLVKTPYLGQSLAKTLGQHPAALLRGHGAVVVGETIARSVGRSIYLEQSARMQMQAMLIAGPGAALMCFDESEVQASMSAQNYNRAWPMWRAQALAKLRSKPLTDFLPQWPVK